jgi:hypothetical protein
LSLEAHCSYSSSAGYFVPRSANCSYYLSAGVVVPRIAPLGQQRLGIIRVRAFLSLKSLLWASSALVLFECGRSCPLKRTTHILRVRAILSLEAHYSYSSSAGYLVPRSALLIFFGCGLSCPSKLTAYIIRVQAILSLELLFWVFSTCIIIRVRTLCPSNRFIMPSSPPYYSSADAVSLESLHQAFSASILFECGRSVPQIALSGLQRLHIIRVRTLCPSNRFIRLSAPPYYSSMGCLVLRISILGCQCFPLIFPETW